MTRLLPGLSGRLDPDFLYNARVVHKRWNSFLLSLPVHERFEASLNYHLLQQMLGLDSKLDVNAADRIAVVRGYLGQHWGGT